MVKPSDRLAGAPKRSVGIALPEVLNDKVNVLLAIARKDGKRYDRQDIASALVFGGPRDQAELRSLIEKYEHATVASARIKGPRSLQPAGRPGRVPDPMRAKT